MPCSCFSPGKSMFVTIYMTTKGQSQGGCAISSFPHDRAEDRRKHSGPDLSWRSACPSSPSTSAGPGSSCETASGSGCSRINRNAPPERYFPRNPACRDAAESGACAKLLENRGGRGNSHVRSWNRPRSRLRPPRNNPRIDCALENLRVFCQTSR